jgi:hypothetical protein
MIEIFQLSCALRVRAAATRNAKSLAVNRLARVFQPTQDRPCLDVVMSASPMANADLKNTATTGSARKLARSAVRAPSAPESQTTEPSANAQRTTSVHPSPNADLSAMAMSTAPDRSLPATTESARILAMALAAPMPTATSEA